MDFKEKLNNRFSAVMPACAIFNGTDDNINFDKPAIVSGIDTSDFYLAVRFRLPANPATVCLVAGSDINGATTTTRFGIGINTNGTPFWHLTFGAELNISYNFVDSVADGNEHEAVINVDRSGYVQLFMDGVMYYEIDISGQVAFNFAPGSPFRVGSFSVVGTDAATLFFPGTVQFVSFGKRILTPLEISRLDTIRNTSNSFTIYPNGHSTLEYDLSGNAINGTWEGTGSKKSFFKGGYPYASVNGYSVYKKTGYADIQIPYSFAGTPISSPTVPSGYSHDSDVSGTETYLNNASCLIDFDPLGRVHSSVGLFKRSDETIHNSLSRASQYYDASNPYRWHITELTDFSIYNYFFNSSYKDRLFTKYSGGLLMEILNCKAALTGGNLTKAKQYCGINTSAFPNGDCSNMAVSVYSSTRIDGSCTIGSTNESGISWEYSFDNKNWMVHGSSGSGVGSYQYTGLTADTLYYFRARAYIGTNFSAYTSSVSATTYCSEAQTVFNTITDLNSTDKGLLNTFIKGRVASGVWAKLVEFVLDALPSATGQYVNLKSPGTKDNTPTSPAPTHVDYQGNTGGTNKYIDSNFIPATDAGVYVQDSASIFFYNRVNSNAGFDAGVIGANNIRADINCRHTDDKCYWYMNDAGGGTITGVTDSRGMWVLTRTAANVVNIYRNKVSLQTSSRASTGLPTTYKIWFEDINNKGVKTSPSARQQACHGIGGGFTQADVDDLTNGFEVLMDAWGTGVIS